MLAVVGVVGNRLKPFSSLAIVGLDVVFRECGPIVKRECPGVEWNSTVIDSDFVYKFKLTMR
jgi:hypothetical protein